MFALDSNTVSYFFRGNPQVTHRLQELPPSAVNIPAIVVYELRYGLMRLPPAAAQPRLDALAQFLNPLRILDFDDACARLAAVVRSQLGAQGTPIGPHDLLIAATALRHGLALVTRNVREFGRVQGLQVVDWHATTAP